MSRARRLWAAAESIAIGYGGDALVSAATGLARETIRNGRRELAEGAGATGGESDPVRRLRHGAQRGVGPASVAITTRRSSPSPRTRAWEDRAAAPGRRHPGAHHPTRNLIARF